jgi:hypothetical protein
MGKNTKKTISENDFFDKLKMVANNLIDQKEFYKWIESNIIIKRYVSINEKYTTAFVIQMLNPLLNSNDLLMENGLENSPQTNLKNYEITKMLFMLSRYINIDFSRSLRTEDKYDVIFISGFYDYLMNYIEKDFERFSNIVDQVSGANYYIGLKSIFDIVEDLPTNEKLENFANVVNNIDEDKIKVITDTVKILNPQKDIAENLLKEEYKTNNKK